MENWIGIGIWIVMGAVIGLAMRGIVKLDETPGHVPVLMVLGSFAAVIGGMLGVGIFECDDPLALSIGGMGGALVLSVLLTWTYRWGVKGWL